MSQESKKDDIEQTEQHVHYERFVRLLVEHEVRLRAFLRGLLPTWHDVEEVAQETSFVAWRKFAEFDECTNFCGWLLTIGRFEALKHRRRFARSRLVFAEDVWELLEQTSVASPPREIRLDALEQCLERLPTAQRELVLMAHAPEVKINEVAQAANRSVEAVYKAIQRIRAALMDCITRSTAEGATS